LLAALYMSAARRSQVSGVGSRGVVTTASKPPNSTNCDAEVLGANAERELPVVPHPRLKASKPPLLPCWSSSTPGMTTHVPT
jgi:hypothetical protein